MRTTLPTSGGLLTRHDAVLLAVLTALLAAAAWPFLRGFGVAVVAAGIVMAAALRWRHARHSAADAAPTGSERMPSLNIAAIHIGGDVAGLVFVAGTVAIFMISMPAFRWFLAASVAIACGVAILLVAVRAHTR